MSGKKAAIILMGIILLVSLLVVIALTVFYAVYEPSINQSTQSLEFISSNKKI